MGTLHVGVMPGHSALAILGKTIQRFAQDAPLATIALQTQLAKRQLEAIKQGHLDAGLVVWRSLLDPTLTGELVYRDHMVVAMPRAVALAKKNLRRLTQLSDQRFILFPREGSPFLFDMLAKMFEQAGIEALASPTAADMPALMGLVATGVGCAVVPASYRQQCPPSVVLRKMGSLDIDCDIELVYRSGNQDPLLANFVSAARHAVANGGAI